jgi:hypothetical protein
MRPNAARLNAGIMRFVEVMKRILRLMEREIALINVFC